MKKAVVIIAMCFSLASSLVADNTWSKTGNTWDRTLDLWLRGGAEPALWTDTNSPSVLHYFSETQPSNFVEDASGNGYHAQAQGTHPALFWCGKDCGYYFDGANSYMLETNMPMDMGVCSNISFNCWMNAEDSAGVGRGVGYIGTFANSQGKFACVAQVGAIELRINGSTASGNGRLIVAGGLDVGNWRMYTATYDGIGLRLYTNGVLAASNNYSVIMDMTGLKQTVGAFYSSSYCANGNIAKPRWDNRTLTDADVLALYNNGRTNSDVGIISDAGLLAYYPFTNDYFEAYDYADNKVNLDPMPTFANAPTFGGTNDMPAGLTYVEFDGTDDYFLNQSGDVIASVDAITNPRTNDFTLCAWFYINSHNATYGIAGRAPVADSKDGFGLWSCSVVTNHLKAQIGDGVSNVMLPSDEKITTNTWHFAAMRRDDFGTFQMYYDGVWQAQTNVANLDINISDTSEWTVGSDVNGGFPMNGRMLEVRYYPSALTDGEIDIIYQNTGTNNNENRFTLP